jgi:hypothetical protein
LPGGEIVQAKFMWLEFRVRACLGFTGPGIHRIAAAAAAAAAAMMMMMGRPCTSSAHGKTRIDSPLVVAVGSELIVEPIWKGSFILSSVDATAAKWERRNLSM